MNGPSIIMDPRSMFQTLKNLEYQTTNFIKELNDLGADLQQLATLTYAIGFGQLMKQAEKDINEIGHAVVAANNALNSSCKEVINQMVAKFASDGVKSDYTSPPFTEIHIKVNDAERVSIYPEGMRNIFQDYVRKIMLFKVMITNLEYTYEDTQKFWVGNSADKMRQAFKTRVVPKFEETRKVLIY